MMAVTTGDDDLPICEAWLESIGFRIDGLSASVLLSPVDHGAAIVELRVSFESDPYPHWPVSLHQDQGEPGTRDDHVLITSKHFTKRGELRALLHALQG